MAKQKSVFYCKECGSESPKWIGHCPSCNTWNSYIEKLVSKKSGTERQDLRRGWEVTHATSIDENRSKILDQILDQDILRIDTGDPGLNQILGGGLVKGSVVLIAGQPGIGKSTLLLQMAMAIPKSRVLYVSGEESEIQIKIRANRIQGKKNEVYIFSSTQIESILDETSRIQADLLIVDSIQTVYSDKIDSGSGSVSQIKECAFELIKFAKMTGVPIIIIGHITKDGDIAGPKILEHMVDTVVHFEGDRHYSMRILRSLKNRFGSTDDLVMYQMESYGLIQITNPSEILLSQHSERLSGSAIACTIEGIRPLLIETQALVSTAVYGNPQRVANGFDNKRLAMLLAVLEKRCGFQLGMQDVFLNLAGGIRMTDPGIDLSVVAAIISSFENYALHRQICFSGEVGLSGEIRSVNRIDLRIQEARRLGFKAICISKYNGNIDKLKSNEINVVPLANVNELYEKVFEK